MPASTDVVIPVYGNYELTKSCLECLASQTLPHRVIVVDDGSEDDSVDRIKSDWPDVVLVELGTNRGYTFAVNRGVQAGTGDYIVLLNNDVRLHPDCLEQLVAPFGEDEQTGSVAALVLDRREEQIDSFGVTIDVTLAGFARLQGHAPIAALDGGPVLAGPEGTTGAYRRSAWEQVGGFDEEIRAYMEIVDLALRLQIAGWQVAQAPSAIGAHLGSATFGKRSAQQRRLAGFSRGYLLRRYGVLSGRAAPRTLLTEALVIVGDLVVCRDWQAARGRWQGWATASGQSRHPRPPQQTIDRSISLRESLALRRGAIGKATLPRER